MRTAWCCIRLLVYCMWAGWCFSRGDLIGGHFGVFVSFLMALQWGYEHLERMENKPSEPTPSYKWPRGDGGVSK